MQCSNYFRFFMLPFIIISFLFLSRFSLGYNEKLPYHRFSVGDSVRVTLARYRTYVRILRWKSLHCLGPYIFLCFSFFLLPDLFPLSCHHDIISFKIFTNHVDRQLLTSSPLEMFVLTILFVLMHQGWGSIRWECDQRRSARSKTEICRCVFA